MPLINDKKFSCEPCIRGHRATSCQHTDRMLIEVRKPGRPMQTCGHHFATCVCGRLADVFPIEAPATYDVQTMAPATPLSKTAAGIRKARLKTRRSSNSQRQEKTRASTEPRKSASPLLSLAGGKDMAEYSAVDIGADEPVVDSGVGYTTPAHIHLEEHTTDSAPVRNLSMVEETPRSTSLPPITSLLSRTQGFLSTPPSNFAKEYSSMFQHNTTSSSRIEDISITPNPVDVSSDGCHAQTHVRTQYIMVKRDDRWRPWGGAMH